MNINLSAICVFLSDTVSVSRYMLSDGKAEAVSLEKDMPIYPPCGINLKIRGQDGLLKKIFRYILENTDFEKCNTNDFFFNIIVPEWGAWTTEEARRNTEEAARQVLNESDVQYPYVWNVKVQSLRDNFKTDVITKITDSALRFFPPEASEQVCMKFDVKSLVAAMHNYTDKKLAMRIICDDKNMKIIKNAVVGNKRNDVTIIMQSVSEADKDMFDFCIAENREQHFGVIKKQLIDSLPELASDCENKFVERLYYIPDEWIENNSLVQSFFTFFFDNVYKPALRSAKSTKSKKKLLKIIIQKAVNESAKSKQVIEKAYDEVYTDEIIGEAVKILDGAVYLPEKAQIFDCSSVKKRLKQKLDGRLSDIARLAEAQNFCYGTDESQKLKKDDIKKWLDADREEAARIQGDIINYLKEKYSGTLIIFADAVAEEYINNFEGGLPDEKEG